jgi:hypothetical protein
MAKRLRSIYTWREGALEQVGAISEARLWAWEYRAEGEGEWDFASGTFRDTVRMWKTSRPDLAPEILFVGDFEAISV